MYDTLASFAQTWGMLLFIALFMGAGVYALWPRNQTKFDAAARLPLEDFDTPVEARKAVDDGQTAEDANKDQNNG